jgi:hypothetical protein
MSNYLAIATVTAALRDFLQTVVPKAVSEADVTIRRPGKPGDQHQGKAAVNIYLYQVTPNPAWRNADLPTRDSNGTLRQRPQTALDLDYLLSFYGDEVQMVPQRLLGKVVAALHANPALSPEQIHDTLQTASDGEFAKETVLKNSDLAEQIEHVRFTPTSLSLEELSKLWSIFQVPYVLSVTYQASVVLIDSGDEEPTPILPVRERQILTRPFRQIVIDQIIPEEGADHPIHVGSRLLILGKGLRGEYTEVRIAGQRVLPRELDVSDTHITLPLSSLSTSLQAGVLGLQVVHLMSKETPDLCFESNVAPFVLRPTITKDRKGKYEITVDEVEADEGETKKAKVTVKLKPEVGRQQRVVLLLNELNPSASPAKAYSFNAQARSEDSDTMVFQIGKVEPGDYLARVQVDGAESPLDSENNGYTGPKVKIE